MFALPGQTLKDAIRHEVVEHLRVHARGRARAVTGESLAEFVGTAPRAIGDEPPTTSTDMDSAAVDRGATAGPETSADAAGPAISAGRTPGLAGTHSPPLPATPGAANDGIPQRTPSPGQRVAGDEGSNTRQHGAGRPASRSSGASQHTETLQRRGSGEGGPPASPAAANIAMAGGAW